MRCRGSAPRFGAAVELVTGVPPRWAKGGWIGLGGIVLSSNAGGSSPLWPDPSRGKRGCGLMVRVLQNVTQGTSRLGTGSACCHRPAGHGAHPGLWELGLGGPLKPHCHA